MLRRWTSRRSRRAARSKAFRLLLLGLFLIAAHGALPSPILVARLIGKTHERFPCDTHACGCWTAEQCWGNCCCFSPDDRLAWAMREGVPVPPTARGIQRLARRAAPPAHTQKAETDCALCVSSEPEPTPNAPVAPSIGPLGCQGLATWLVLTVPPMVIPAVPTPDAPHQASAHLAEARLDAQIHRSIDPPPPRA